MQSLSMPCIGYQSVSGNLGMSNQKRPALLRAIKHLLDARVVTGRGCWYYTIGTDMARSEAKGPLRGERALKVNIENQWPWELLLREPPPPPRDPPPLLPPP